MGEIDYGSCYQDASPSLSPFPFPFPPLSRERETASVMAHASPSLGPRLPLHSPCGPNHDVRTWAIHLNGLRK